MTGDGQFLIDKLGLEKHEEGGYFKRTYESALQIELPGYDGKRCIGSAIYYLILGSVNDPFHRLKSDEIWHFYCGSSLILYTLTQDGTLSSISMGHDIKAGQAVQVVVKAGTWFGAEVDDPSSYSLIGCTVSPGFDPRDFEFGSRNELTKEYPHHRSIIERLTRSA